MARLKYKKTDGTWSYADVSGGGSGSSTYISADEPTDAPIGSVWIDTDDETGGGSSGWRKIIQKSLDADATYVTYTQDDDGNSFACDEMLVVVSTSRGSEATANGTYCISTNDWTSSYNSKAGINGLNLLSDLYTAVVKIMRVDNLVVFETQEQFRSGGNISAVNWAESALGVHAAGSVSSMYRKVMAASNTPLLTDGKITKVTVGVDMATSPKLIAGTRIEVWIR